MGRPTPRVDWEPVKRLASIIWWPFGQIISHFARAKIKPADSGIFDPYVPLGSLKKVKAEYNEEVGDFIEEEPRSSSDEPVPTFAVVKVLAFLVAAVFAFRLISLQITQGQENYQLARGNALRTELQGAPRGIIYDRNGVALVTNIPSFSIVLNPSEIPTKADERLSYLKNLAAILAVDDKDLTTNVNNNRKKDQIVLADNLSRDQALSFQLKLSGLSGTYLITSPVRQYSPTVPGLGHLLGYIGKLTDEEKNDRPDLVSSSLIGKSGLELQYDRQLQGSPGLDTYEVDSKGTRIRQVNSQPPVPGQSLVLGLDSGLQQVASTALADTITKNHATSGAAVVMDVRTGDILAMASAPTFDNNLFSPTTSNDTRTAILSNPLSPLLNRAVAGQYPSGSTIKPIYAASALQEGVITANTKIDTSAGQITVGQSVFHDWRVHGIADVKQAIAESNNIFFYTIGGGHGPIGGLGINRLDNYLNKFGFGRPTGIDLPGEKNGNVPTPDWLKKTYNEQWYLGDTYNLSIGQGGLLITPLQLTRAISSIANGGTLYQPKMVKSIVGQNGANQAVEPITSQKGVIDPADLEIVRQGMRQTVTSGSAAQTFRTFPVNIAAKTGTAQVTQSLQNTHAWFTSFAPYESPEIAISVIVEGGGEGWAVAAPVAKNIYEQYFHLPLSPINPAPPGE